MRAALVALTLCALATPALAEGDKRCGWLANPTPGNYWLTDRDYSWVLSYQGGDSAPGFDDLPGSSFDFGADWVETNGYYGYGCACITGYFGADGTVLEVTDMNPLPLSRCEADPDLPAAEG